MHKTLTRNILLWLSLSLCLFNSNFVFAAEEEDEGEAIEEVIVTGSYIRRDNFDLPSPIAVTTEVDLELAGTSDLGDVIFDQTFQYGVNANATPFEGGGADAQEWNQGQEVWANLRGLGTRATMTMSDGHRLLADTNTWGRRTGVDVNAAYPSIAIGRIETILDGASALYGAEAVGGVINIIPKKDFEGLEIEYNIQQAFDNGAPTTNLAMLAGVQGERGGAIFAMELRDQERMRFTDRPDYILASADPWEANSFTTWWNDAAGRSGAPSEFNVPQRNSLGNLIPQWGGPFPANLDGGHPTGHYVTGPLQAIVQFDPGCGFGFGSGHNDGGTLNYRGQFASPDRFGVVDPAWAGATTNERFQNPLTQYNSFSLQGNNLNGTIDPRGFPQCRNTISDFQDMQAASDHNKAMAYFDYEFNDYVKLRGEIVVSLNDYNTRDVTGAFDEVDTTTLLGNFSPIVLGENPGNPFRAFADGLGIGGFTGIANGILDWDDANGNRQYEYGIEAGEAYVFAQDANGDGIPDRDFDGNGTADVGAQGEVGAIVLLMGLDSDADGDGLPDRFDQDVLGNGGVRLFEDVRVRGGELNVHPKNPRNNNIEWAKYDGSGLHYLRRFIRDNTRLRLGTEVAIPDTDWIIDLDYVYSQGRRVNFYPEPQLSNYIKALRCKAGPNGDACWNPFSTQYLQANADGQLIGDPTDNFPSPTAAGWTPPDAIEVNTELENRYAGVILNQNQQDLKMQIVDVIASTGSLFELPWNDLPVGFAIGGHFRIENEEWRPNSLNQLAIGGGKRGLRESEQETEAYFAEIQLPLMDHEDWGVAELQLATRHAKITTTGIVGQRGQAEFTTDIPKVAFRWAPNDWISLRASMTEGFVTPGLFSLFGEPDTSSATETVGDYICDNLPEIADCASAVPQTGNVPNVSVGNSPNSDLGAETSELYNVGISFRLLDGDLTLDADFTSVDFDGRVEQIGATANVAFNSLGFQDYLIAQCPGTVPDWDNPSPNPAAASDGSLATLTLDQYRELVGQAELDCRVGAATSWVNSAANGGLGERALGSSRLERGAGPNGLMLSLVEEPWVEQGLTTTETMIYSLRYRFDAEQIPVIGGDYGSFALNVSATQMLEQSITRYTSLGCEEAAKNVNTGLCPGDNPFAGIKVDGVGNRNTTSFVGPGEGLYGLLAPSPEFRLNVGLRWFLGNHTAQLSGRWHDSVTNLNIAWDELRANGNLSAGEAALEEKDRCSRQPSEICRIGSKHYWDLSYTYNRPDFLGMNASVNFAIRNLFDTYPKPIQTSSGYDGYLDNIMGRTGYLRLSVSL
jgi:outer membrane receptor protein involved in Fe transport